MFCQNCGKEIDDDAKVCAHCGATVTDGEAPKSPASAQKQNGGVNAGGLVCGVVAIVCCFIGIFIFGMPLAITGLILAIIGLTLGVKNLKESRNPAVMIVAILGLIFAIVELIIVIAAVALAAAALA